MKLYFEFVISCVSITQQTAFSDTFYYLTQKHKVRVTASESSQSHLVGTCLSMSFLHLCLYMYICTYW